MKYRPKKCMECGGKMPSYQMGGVYTSQKEIDAANAFARDFTKRKNAASQLSLGDTYVAKDVGDNVVPFLGVDGRPFTPLPSNRKLAYDVPNEITLDDIKSYEGQYWYENNNGDIVDVDPSVVNLPRFRNNSVAKRQWGGFADIGLNIQQGLQNQKQEQEDPWMPYKTLRSAKTFLSELSGRSERGRQDQYFYNQQSSLGQMEPMPVQDFQPNPFSLYAKYGGSLKKYQNGGVTKGLIPTPRYPATLHTKNDTTEYNYHFNDMVNKDPYAINRYKKLQEMPLVSLTGELDDNRVASFWNTLHERMAYEDASNPNVMSDDQVQSELARLYRPKDVVRKKK